MRFESEFYDPEDLFEDTYDPQDGMPDAHEKDNDLYDGLTVREFGTAMAFGEEMSENYECNDPEINEPGYGEEIDEDTISLRERNNKERERFFHIWVKDVIEGRRDINDEIDFW